MSMTPHDNWHAVPARTDSRLKVTTRPQPGTFGRLVRDHRMNLDISQAAIAERMGCDHSYISRIESNARTPDKISTVLALASALQLGAAQTVELLRAAAEGERG